MLLSHHRGTCRAGRAPRLQCLRLTPRMLGSLPQPLTLHNVFISNQGTRVTLGRIPWGERVEADDTGCSSKLAARSQLLAASFAGMLTDMLAHAADAPRTAAAGAGAGTGAGAGAGAIDAGGDASSGAGATKMRAFSRMQCLRGLHVKSGESFVVRAPPGPNARHTRGR